LFENNTIIANTLNDAWRDAMWCCVRNGYDYIIEKGSYCGETRKQLENVQIIITEPWKRPFKFYTPPGIPEPTDEEKINLYFNDYIITNTKTENEDYTYGMYISQQVHEAIEHLNSSNGNSNQACITIGDIDSIKLVDPPCLRVIDFKVVNGHLNMTLFFRSWDLFAGLPENLGGLQLLKEYVLYSLNFPIKDGQLIAYSSGLHLYSMYFPLVNQLNIDQINLNKGDE
jgi:thymidylate synthase